MIEVCCAFRKDKVIVTLCVPLRISPAGPAPCQSLLELYLDCLPWRGLCLDSATYLVYHEEGNKIAEGFNDQLPELEGHEGGNRSKIFLNVSRGVVVTLGSEADPVFLL